jgi:cytochrome P450
MTDVTTELTSTYPFPRRHLFQPPWELAWLRHNAPVSPVRLANGGTGWLVTRLDDVRAVLCDERFSRRPVREVAARDHGRPSGDGGGAFDFGLSIANPADHRRWRRMLNPGFTPRHAESMRPRIGTLVDELLDEMAEAGPPADLMAGVAFRLPIAVICELFDVPAPLRSNFHDWAARVRGAGSVDAISDAMRSLYQGAAGLVAAQRDVPGSGCLGMLAAIGDPNGHDPDGRDPDGRDPDGRGLSDQELVSTVLLLTIAGYETVAAQLGNGFLALFQHPAELDALKADESMVVAAVEEILRYAQASTGFAGTTYTTCDVELGGVMIPAGSAVFVSLDSAGRDEEHVVDPDRLDLARGCVRTHLAFGSGPHHCLGAPLARVELQEAVRRIVHRFPDLRPAAALDQVPLTTTLLNTYPSALPIAW